MKKILMVATLSAVMNTGAFAENVLRYAFQGDLDGLDPQSNTTFQIGTLGNIYDPLIGRDNGLNLEPALATSWKRLSQTKWEFELRKGVKFHNGEDFTAEDVVFTIKRGLNASIEATAKRIKEVKIINPHKIVIETKESFALLPSALTTVLIMDKGWTIKNKAGDYSVGNEKLITATQANGTGLFKLKHRQPGVKTEFTRWKGHWDKSVKTNIDRIVFTPIQQSATRVAALLSGVIDFAYPIPVQDKERVNNAKNVHILAGPETRTIFLGMDQWRDELVGSDVKGKNPFKDKRVRQAFAHAIDTQLITKKVMRGAAYPTGVIVGRFAGYPGKDLAKPYAYDIKKSRKLLAEAGYPNGFKVVLDCPNNRYVNDEKICQSVVSMLGKVGVKVDLNAQPKAQFFKKVLSSGGFNTSFYLLGLSPGTLNTLSTAEYAVACRDVNPGLGTTNLGNYCNLENNKLLVQANKELDAKKRDELIRQVFKNTKNDVGYLPLHDQALSWGVNDNFVVKQRADNVFVWKNVVKK